MNHSVAALSLLFVTSVGACATDDGPFTGPLYCADDLPALIVYVRDSLTGNFVGSNAIVAATANNSTLTMPISSERPDANPYYIPGAVGVYTLSVRRAGYTDWMQSNIHVVSVSKSPCDIVPQPVEITARLVPITN